MVHWLASSPQLHEKRGRVILTTIAVAGLIIAGIGAIPFPDYRRGWGIIEPSLRYRWAVDVWTARPEINNGYRDVLEP